MAIFANNICLEPFLVVPSQSMLFFFVDTRTKVFLSPTKCWHGKSGLEIGFLHIISIALKACKGVQTQRWNTKTSETTPIIDVQRYLKRLNGQKFDNRERGGMRFAPKGLRGKFYDAQKGSFHIGKMVVIL